LEAVIKIYILYNPTLSLFRKIFLLRTGLTCVHFYARGAGLGAVRYFVMLLIANSVFSCCLTCIDDRYLSFINRLYSFMSVELKHVGAALVFEGALKKLLDEHFLGPNS
jgi:hypothetical protein